MESSVRNIAYEFYFVAKHKLMNLLRNIPVFYQAKETAEHSFPTNIEYKSIIRNHMLLVVSTLQSCIVCFTDLTC